MGSAEPRRVLLVGFMGSGKSTVGRWLARRLHWRLVEFDERVAARYGAPVHEIFEREGEAAFRRLEAEVGRAALLEDRAVLASGGGWPVGAPPLDTLDASTVSVWLSVSLDSALARAGSDRVRRPLLEQPDARARMQALLSRREPYYRRARIHLLTDGRSPEDVASAILEHVRRAGSGAQ